MEKVLPCEQFGVSEDQTPEIDVVSVREGGSSPACRHEFLQLQKTPLGSIERDSALFSLFPAKRAEAGPRARLASVLTTEP